MAIIKRDGITSANRIDRQTRHEAFWQGRKKHFFLVIAILSMFLQALFVGNMSYLYGSIYKSSDRYHAFNVLFIDYDGGVVGKSVREAYDQLKGPGFPTLIQHDIGQYPTPQDVVNAVKDTSYWAAFMSNQNASLRLAHALQGGEAAKSYDATSALTYVWNEVRYPPFSDQAFQGNFETLVAACRLKYNMLNGSSALASMDDKDAVQVLLNPILASSLNLMPTPQPTKLFYNTVSMVMPILQQFFFLLILNGLSQEVELYSKLPIRISGLVRIGISVGFDFLASFCMTGYIWAFRESWPVTMSQFVLTWMLLWLLMHIHFLISDIATAFLPLPALPFFLLTWIILNITSSISPFELSPGFYRFGYAMPANSAYTVLTDIWSSGSVPQLHRTLPVLFSWWIAALSLATYAHFYRCHKAWNLDMKLEREVQRQINNTDSKPRGLRPTSGEPLLEASELRNSIYGPSLPPPARMMDAFGGSELQQYFPVSDTTLDRKPTDEEVAQNGRVCLAENQSSITDRYSRDAILSAMSRLRGTSE